MISERSFSGLECLAKRRDTGCDRFGGGLENGLGVARGSDRALLSEGECDHPLNG